MVNESIDTSNLYEGQMFSSYKELCTTIGIAPKAGNSRQPQKEKLRRFFNFIEIQNSNRIEITKIYDEALPEKPMTRRKTSEYAEFIFKIILLSIQQRRKIAKTQHWVVTDYDNKFTSTKTKLLFVLGFFNSLYVDTIARTNLNKIIDGEFGTPSKLYWLTEEYKFNSKTVNTRFIFLLSNTCWRIFYIYLKRGIENLEKLNMIKVEEKYKVFDKKQKKYRYTTKDEAIWIKEDMNASLKKLNCKTTFEVRAKFKQHQYNKLLDDYLSEMDFKNLHIYYEIEVCEEFDVIFKKYFGEPSQTEDLLDTIGFYREELNNKIADLCMKAVQREACKLYDDIQNPQLNTTEQHKVDFIKKYLKRQNLIDDESSPDDIKKAYLSEAELFINCCVKLKYNREQAENEINKRLNEDRVFNYNT